MKARHNFNSDRNMKSLISANAVPGWIYTHPGRNLKMSLTSTLTRQTSPAFASFIPKLISEISILTLLLSVKLLMLQHMVTPPALRLDDDDVASDDVVAICLCQWRTQGGSWGSGSPPKALDFFPD
ncbi:hypothetical protein TNCV_687941 [Trichonephila clavipes]|nr:hypothetical protein TNCV_687941 [Trichonephila clavipes]